jgi:hypothetical protein
MTDLDPNNSAASSEIRHSAHRQRPERVDVVRLIVWGFVLPGVVVLLLYLREPRIRSGPPSREMQCRNNIHNIGLALLSYASSNRDLLPPAYVADKEGRPIHSWRALTLFELNEYELSRQYRKDEPWNGPRNSQLADRWLGFYHCPDDPGPNSETSYMVVVGPQTAFTGAKPRSMKDVEKGHGASNTILTVEVANSGVRWSEPRDVQFEDAIRGVNRPGILGISSAHKAYWSGPFVHASFADGRVQAIRSDIDPEVLKQLLQVEESASATSR